MSHRRTFVSFAVLFAATATLGRGGAARAQDFNEKYRPQFHFTAPQGWLNDPNGLVYYDGEYHMFYQHNPGGTGWQPTLSWGHAISPDLVHWEHLPIAIGPESGTFCGAWSGSAAVDTQNTAGFQTGAQKTIVLMWTAMGSPQCGQNIAYSTDRGRTFTKWKGNPVIKAEGDARDPQLFWYAAQSRWHMTYWVGKGFSFFSSPDLKSWTRRGSIDGFYECPNLFPLPLEGGASSSWVLHGADGKYLLGGFDGASFTKQAGPFPLDWGGTFYAGQSWNEIPPADGRRINITWMREGKYPGMKFNQQMTLATVLTLRNTANGPRIFRQPVKALEDIRVTGQDKHWQDEPLAPGVNPLAGITGELYDLTVEFEPGAASEVGLRVRGENVIAYDPAAKKVSTKIPTSGNKAGQTSFSAPLAPDAAGRVRLRVIIDRTSIEVFGNDGEVTLSNTFVPTDDRSLVMYALGGAAKVTRLDLYPLRSIWSKDAVQAAWAKARSGVMAASPDAGGAPRDSGGAARADDAGDVAGRDAGSGGAGGGPASGSSPPRGPGPNAGSGGASGDDAGLAPVGTRAPGAHRGGCAVAPRSEGRAATLPPLVGVVLVLARRLRRRSATEPSARPGHPFP